jgi:hypothetical protein
MTKSNDQEQEDDFWKENYEPSERTKEALTPDHNEITREASISFDGEQYYVRFPKEIAEIIKLSKKDKVKFTGIENPETENEVEIELVKKEDDQSEQ